MQREYFGTDGIRAKVGSRVMHPQFLLKLGWAIGSIIGETHPKPSVIIGRDTRLSGEMIEAAIVSGLLAAGCNVILLGVIPTPVISFLTSHYHVSAGIIISASHNPYQDNGIKCIDADGMKLPDEWEARVESKIKEEMTIAKTRV